MMRAMSVDFPQPHVSALQDMAARLFDKRKAGTDFKPFARDLLRGFYDVCAFGGLDRVLSGLAEEHPSFDVTERTSLEDVEPLFAGLVSQLDTNKVDAGSPRNTKARQLADCVIAALGLNVVDEPDRNITLDDSVRAEVAAAIAGVVDRELALPKVREAIIAEASRRCDEAFHPSFAKVVAVLDDRGVKLTKTPKIPVDALRAIERALLEARNTVIERVSRAALDRAKTVLAKTNPDAAARLDAPVTLTATPRDVAILRASDDRVAMTPPALVHSLVESLGQLARITWRAPERPVHPYSATKTFVVGDLIEHPKFGRGTVVSLLANRIDVEFPEGKYTLVHVPPRR
jgi:hypothetical protein